MKTEIRDTIGVMSRIDTAWPEPTPEERERCLRMLEAHDALDVAGMLGLVAA